MAVKNSFTFLSQASASHSRKTEIDHRGVPIPRWKNKARHCIFAPNHFPREISQNVCVCACAHVLSPNRRRHLRMPTTVRLHESAPSQSVRRARQFGWPSQSKFKSDSPRPHGHQFRAVIQRRSKRVRPPLLLRFKICEDL